MAGWGLRLWRGGTATGGQRGCYGTAGGGCTTGGTGKWLGRWDVPVSLVASQTDAPATADIRGIIGQRETAEIMVHSVDLFCD